VEEPNKIRKQVTMTADDSEGRLERRIFRELFAEWPNGGEDIETSMFPLLFPTGNGVFDQDRPRQMRFVEHRDHVRRQFNLSGRGRTEEWLTWANSVAEAIERRKRGEDIAIEFPSNEERMAAMDEKLRTTPMEQKMTDPFKIKTVLLAMGQVNPAYREEQGIDAVVETRLAEARQSDWSVIKECAACHRYECPQHPDLKLSRCAKCHHVFYCGREHQAQDWPKHKKRCKKVAKAMNNS
jgi:hypothetical protein